MIRLSLALILLAAPAVAETVMSGNPRVIDGDTIVLAGQSLRLAGIDAPEMSQPVGPASRDALVAIIAGREVVCAWDGSGVYGRPLATCAPVLASGRVSAVSVNALMVRAGWAAAGLPYGYEFERQQSLAMAGCRGMWAAAGLPWCWRRAER